MRSGSERLRVVSFKAEEELIEAADRAAAAMRVPRSQVIREALRRYLENLGYYPPAGGGGMRVVKIRVV